MNAKARVVTMQTPAANNTGAQQPAPPASAVAAPDWIETPTAIRIVGALSYAQAVCDVAVIDGGAGVGKTSAARHYVATNAQAWHVVMSPATTGVVPALEEVCAAIGIPKANGAAPLHRAIVGKLSDKGGLLIVDEAQHLAPAALEQLRGIHDIAGIGLALLGSRDVYARMLGGDHAGALDRLRSRVGKHLALAAPMPGDIDAIAAAWGIGSAAGRKLLADIASKAGGLRGVVKALRLARVHADATGRPVADADLRAAWRDLGLG